MFVELILSILCGILAGTITGLTPGLHINLIAVFIVTLSPILPLEPISLIVFIVSMATTHSFLDAIPSIFLGAPDESHILSALPGHKMLLEGRGIEAIEYTVWGGLISSLCIVLLCVPAFFLVTFLDDILAGVTVVLLILVISYLLFNEQSENIVHALFIFLLSGIFGIMILQSQAFSQPLLPLLSGLFGISMLIDGFLEKTTIPPQKETHAEPLFKESFVATVSGFCAAFLPGIGTSQIAIIASAFARKSAESFLTLTGGMNTASVAFSIITLTAIQKSRNGAMVAIQDLIGIPSMQIGLLLFGTAIVACGISAFLTIRFAVIASKLLPKIPYKICIVTICLFLLLLTWNFDGVLGLLVLLTSTALGYYAIRIKIPKHYLMGCLLIPVICFFI